MPAAGGLLWVFSAWLRPHWGPSSNPEAHIGGLGPCTAGLASMKLKSHLGSISALAPLPTQSPHPPPLTGPPACLLASAWVQSLIRPCSVAPLLRAWFLEHRLVPPYPSLFPGVPSPALTSSSPYNPELLLRAPSRSHIPWSRLLPPKVHLRLRQPRTHPLGFVLIAPSDFSALHLPGDSWGPGPQGIRGASA